MSSPDAPAVLVTGASGFLGSWLADAAAASGSNLLGIDLRAPAKPQIWTDFATGSCESVDLARLFRGRQVSAVFHLAGGASVPVSVQDPFSDFSSLLPASARLATFLAKNHPSTRLVFFSSAAVYGNPTSLPVSESSPIRPISPYGIHKATAEFLFAHYARISGLSVSVLRIFSAYGPGLRKQLLWDVAQKAMEAFAAGEKSITLSGTGRETRDFIFAADIAKAALLLATVPGNGNCETFNVGTGVESTISEVATRLIEALELEIDVEFNGIVRAGDPANWQSDIRKLQRIGFVAEVQIGNGISRVARWIRDDCANRKS